MLISHMLPKVLRHAWYVDTVFTKILSISGEQSHHAVVEIVHQFMRKRMSWVISHDGNTRPSGFAPHDYQNLDQLVHCWHVLPAIDKASMTRVSAFEA